MNPYSKAAQFVVRLAGFGVVAVSLILLLGNIALIVSDRPPDGAPILMLEIFCFLMGCVVLFKSRAIAERLTGDLADDLADDEETSE